jgi:glutathione S-transferase
VGFIHLSAAHQVEATAQRFYGDLPPGEVVLLSIDPQRLAAAGLELRSEPAPATGELFPHLYGALPLEAVLLAQPFTA